MLHDIELPQPCLIKGITGGVNNVTQSVLLRQDQHRVKETFHCFVGLNESGPVSIAESQQVTNVCDK